MTEVDCQTSVTRTLLQGSFSVCFRSQYIRPRKLTCIRYEPVVDLIRHVKNIGIIEDTAVGV